MFEREHHRRVASVLEKLDHQLLLERGCLFGGGTAIALRFGEYRDSLDIDFLVSDLKGYRALRERFAALGLKAIARSGYELVAARDVRADQYGIRTAIDVHGAPIKLEIVLEARIALERPASKDRICNVFTLTPLDMVASKLLANSDRWADDSVHSRDLIDLAMLAPRRELLRAAIEKARAAYGASVERDLARAIAALQQRPGRLSTCMQALQMSEPPPGVTRVLPAVLWRRIRKLVPKS